MTEGETGWKRVAGSPAKVELIDTLLDMPPHREVNITELAEFAGVSRSSVHRHLDDLVALGILTEVPETTQTRYRFEPKSTVSHALMKLDGAVNSDH